VYSDGRCLWWPLFEESASHCPLDVTWYPFDDQRCNLSFESWKYNSDVLNLTVRQLPELYSHYNANEEWTLLGREFFGGVVVMALDLRLEIAGSIPAAALSSATSGKLFAHTCLCHQAV